MRLESEVIQRHVLSHLIDTVNEDIEYNLQGNKILDICLILENDIKRRMQALAAEYVRKQGIIKYSNLAI